MRNPFPHRRLLAGICLLTFGLATVVAGCQGTPGEATPVPLDDFAVVRAIAEASYQRGRAHLAQGELEAALVELDRAKVNDPDGRPDIQGALEETLQRIQALPPTPRPVPRATSTPIPAVGAPLIGVQQSSGAAARAQPANATPGLPTGFAIWEDKQGRFSLAVPADWVARDAPPSAFGTGIVGFRDPGNRAEFVVSADTSAPVVSPELYAAKMEIAMQAVPGYSLESVVPGVLAGTPSVRRQFTISSRDPGGQGGASRGFQVTVLEGNTPYILTSLAPSSQDAAFEPTFERILSSFAFR